jgi:hypothetical protein
MINSTHNVHINGTVLNEEELKNTFDFSKGDAITRWLLRPLAVLAAIGMGVAAFLASAFLLVLSLAMLPLLAVGLWAVKHKMEKDHAAADPVVDTQ